uniref:Uncharacterized protein n=1 Tax=Kalanchoe fedtschenkoi TaxID=63787 RepID=A0A7N0UUD5_KALFE
MKSETTIFLGQMQTRVLSPSKLRMKLIGAGHNLRKKDGSKQSNTSSSRTSPSKHQESDYGQLVKESILLPAEHEAKGFDEEGLKLELLSVNSCSQGGQSSPQSQELASKVGWSKKQQQQVRKSESANRVSIVHPARTAAEDVKMIRTSTMTAMQAHPALSYPTGSERDPTSCPGHFQGLRRPSGMLLRSG